MLTFAVGDMLDLISVFQCIGESTDQALCSFRRSVDGHELVGSPGRIGRGHDEIVGGGKTGGEGDGSGRRTKRWRYEGQE